ncbi:hypothetical protein [Eubacterium ramulus]|uniref:hypothetical protein n=1 Tax=Eubacterium ramulus TaxID=39490 RepID=UPI0022E0D786|nr:hypothetical protein [Eubacterium ramulus]
MITGMGFIGTKTGGLYRMNGRRTVKKTASGNPITLTDSVENKPLGMKLYGWSKQDGEPSPENPVEIESAGMKWSTGKNLFDERLLDNKNNYDKQYQSSGFWKLAIPVKNEPVTVSVKNTTNWGGYLCINNTGSTGSTGGIWMAHGYVSHLKRTVTLTSTHGFIYLLMSTSVDANKRTLEEVGYIQVEYGSEATGYEPYDGGIPKLYGDKVGVSVRGKNLFHITKESDCDKAYDKGTKRIILPGEYIIGLSANNFITSLADANVDETAISFTYGQNKSGYGIAVGIECEHGKTYKHSRQSNLSDVAISFYDTDGTFITYTRNNPFTVPENAKYTVFVLNNSSTTKVGNTVSACNIQIEEGTDVTAYESYRIPQSTSIITPNGLPGIPVPSNTAGITYTDANGQAWIADEIDLERGKYVQRVWQAEFDGSKDEAWTVSGTTFYSPSLPTNMKFRDGVTNKYAVRNVQNIQCVNFGRGNTALCVANPSEYDGSLDDKGLSNFKAHLATNSLVVMTYLDNTIERDLTSAELEEYTQLYSYKPTTVVENDSDCWMDVTYRGKK